MLIINKINLLKNKNLILPLINTLSKTEKPKTMMPISTLSTNNIKQILNEMTKLLPKKKPQFNEDTITDHPLHYFATKYVRKPILTSTNKKIPHTITITIKHFAKRPNENMINVKTTIHVEHNDQKHILVEHKDKMIKHINTHTHQRLKDLVKLPVNLQLFVHMTKN